MYKLRIKLIVFFVLFLIIQSKAVANINFNAKYYSNKSIYKNEYEINFYEKFFNNNIDVGGYIKQGIINKNRFEQYLDKNNDIFNLSRKFNINDDKNYFYKIYLKLKIADFEYQNFSDINNFIFFNISYYNSIKYYKLLELTFINDIYEKYGIGINYLLNNYNFLSNFYIDYMISKKNIKDILNIGFDIQQILSSSFILNLNYKYSKDFDKKNNKQYILDCNNIAITYYYDIIMNDSHSLDLNSIFILDEYLNFTVGFSYTINKNYDNNFGINFNIGF